VGSAQPHHPEAHAVPSRVGAGGQQSTTSLDRAPALFYQQIPKIQAVALHLERKGKSTSTIKATTKNLKLLAQRTDLQDTKEVELAIARYKKVNGQPSSNCYKAKLCVAYRHYCQYYKIQWEKPTYTPEEKSIQPPSTEKCDLLIASAKGIMSLKIAISTETGLRPIEVTGEKGLKTKDIHTDQKTITAINTKRCNARPPMKISNELTARLQTYITEKQLKPNDLLFTGSSDAYSNHFIRFKKRLAEKLNDQSIVSIRLYDLRHAYVTKQLRRTQNAEKVRIIVGHKKLNTTQKYLHLLNTENGEWECEYATNKEEAKKLIKADFTYVTTTPDGTMLFRKPK
jgi:hypothetical protein